MPNDLLAIDLSSERVRLATWLLDGVRQGQPLGALLGYRFERRLQEARKAQFISLLPRTRAAGGAEAGAINQPVETGGRSHRRQQRRGWAGSCMRRWQQSAKGSSRKDHDTIPFGRFLDKDRCSRSDKRRNESGSCRARRSLDDAVDAVSDALMAESVYQVVRGNPLRAASTVESIAGGETPPPELEVVRTPRTGIALTHRLVTLFSGEPMLPPEWAPPANSVSRQRRATPERLGGETARQSGQRALRG